MRTKISIGVAAVVAALLPTLLATPASGRTAEYFNKGVQPHHGQPYTESEPYSSGSSGAAARLGDEWTVREPFSSYRMAWVEQFDLCLGVWIRGEIRAKLSRTAIPAGVFKKLHEPRLIDPYMLVTTKRSCDDSSEPKFHHRANSISYHHYFYGYTCSYDPSFNYSPPWSVGVGVTPDCGEERVARLGDHQTNARDAYRFELETNGYAFGWDDSDSGMSPDSQRLCTSVSGYFVLRDTDGAERAKAMRKVQFSDPCVYSSSERI
jgi:hypothetical protein